MLPKRYRGLTAEGIATLFKKKHSSRSNRSFLLIWQQNEGHIPRFAVIFPTRLKITSVNRNKIKRKIFDSLRNAPLVWTEGKNYAILVRSHALKTNFAELEKELHQLFRRH